MGFILSLIAQFLFFIVGFINYPIVLILHVKKRGFWKVNNKYFFENGRDIDVFGNYAYRSTWNLLFIKKDGYKFGKKGETISSALGKNQLNRRLTFFGKIVCFILDKIDKEHCKKSIDEMV